MYFDANGNPKALSKGQYGIKRSGKVNLLLDRNGNNMLCVDNLLNGFPCMVVVFWLRCLFADDCSSEEFKRSIDDCLCSFHSL